MNSTAAAKSASSFGSDPLDCKEARLRVRAAAVHGPSRTRCRPTAGCAERGETSTLRSRYPTRSRETRGESRRARSRAPRESAAPGVRSTPMARAARRRLCLRECRVNGRATKLDRRVKSRRRCRRADASGGRRRGRSPQPPAIPHRPRKPCMIFAARNRSAPSVSFDMATRTCWSTHAPHNPSACRARTDQCTTSANRFTTTIDPNTPSAPARFPSIPIPVNGSAERR